MTHTAFNDNIRGIVTGIERYSIHDGPGIRSLVFLKGCPLSCRWCHNPETQCFKPEIIYDRAKCLDCGACAAVCPQCHSITDGKHSFDRKNCTACGKCVDVCPSALELCGKSMTVAEVIDTVMKDKVFYNHDGGITLSGGEPFAQGEFAIALLARAKSLGLYCAVETCGAVPSDYLSAAVKYTDLFLYDVKEISPQRHKELTGADNRLILENLSLLSANKAKIILRVPVIPGANDSEEHFRGVGELAEKLEGVIRVEVLPYHRAGNAKYAKLGLTPREFKVPNADDNAGYIARIAKYTSKPVKQA